jgi:pyruvate/2-oxoglutarate/acetoin dehydrogenase E1 component
VTAKTVLESLNQGLHEMMTADERVLVLGEDILDPYGGAFKVTRGLSSRFPERVLATPLSESAIVGLASGLAMRGLRPVAEIMFADFLWLAGDQLVNHAAKFRWMYNDAVRVPLVIRTPSGGRRGYGPTHSQSVEKHFCGVPGLRIVAPHILTVPGDLLKRATLDCDDPVVFIENKTCYGRPLVSDVPAMQLDVIDDEETTFPTLHVRHRRSGASDGLVWCYGGMVPHCMEAIGDLRDREGLYLDLVVVSQLSPIPATHIRRILAKDSPSLSVYVEEGSVMFGWSAELAALVQEESARLGEGPIRHERIGAAHTPIPSSRELERQALPQAQDIVARVLECF